VHPGDVFKAVISLYVRDVTLPLPTLDEVLICNNKTTVEEVKWLIVESIKLKNLIDIMYHSCGT